LRAGREDEAREDLAAAIQLAPTLIDARLQLGNSLARRGRFGDAVLEYDRLLLLSPDHTKAYLKRAAARANLGHLTDARLDLEHALGVAREPETIAEARTLLARLDLVQRHLGEAEGHFRAAVAADPENVPALSGLASLLGQRGRYREATVYFRDVITLEPGNGSARLGEAVALLLIEDYANARARLEEGITELPDDLDLKQKLTLLLAACPDGTQRDGPRAVELAKQLFVKRPDAESVEVLAMAYAEAGDFAQATTWQRRLLSAGGAPAGDSQRAVWQLNLTRYESGLSCCADNQKPSPQGEK
jgi:Flp pilus assembly protein TadD